MAKQKVQKIVLAYSGGLDTSVILGWLKQEYQAEVIAYCADVGQGEELAPVEGKARASGASLCIIEDLREVFARDYVFPILRANALYEGTYMLGTSIARPLIARRQAEVALEHGADAVAHGATGKGNDQVRFELTFAALAPQLKIIAPWRDWDFQGRADLIAYAEEHRIPIPVSKEKPYSSDRNLLHISYEGGILEDPWAEPPEDIFLWTSSVHDAPDEPERIEISFEKGVPVALDGEKMKPADLLAALNAIGSRHGVGRVDIVENRFIGIKSRGVYETPGATILLAAHRAVESITLDREVAHFKDSLVPKFAELVYNGFWFAPEMDLLRSMVETTQASVTGTVRLKLFKGGITVTGRKSPYSLYNAEQSSFETRMSIDASDSGGFINVNGLRLSTWSAVWPRL